MPNIIWHWGIPQSVILAIYKCVMCKKLHNFRTKTILWLLVIWADCNVLCRRNCFLWCLGNFLPSISMCNHFICFGSSKDAYLMVGDRLIKKKLGAEMHWISSETEFIQDVVMCSFHLRPIAKQNRHTNKQLDVCNCTVRNWAWENETRQNEHWTGIFRFIFCCM